jgi:hypothetical protein
MKVAVISSYKEIDEFIEKLRRWLARWNLYHTYIKRRR